MTYTGWGVRGRAFTPKEFQNSHIKKTFRGSYSAYLAEFARQYKNKRLRSGLIKLTK